MLAGQGADVIVDYDGPTCIWDKEWRGSAPPANLNVLGIMPVDADVVVIQRPCRRQWVQIIKNLHGQGVKVVVDVDDAFHAIPPHNVAYNQFDPRRDAHVNWQWVDEACKLADVVTVTTEALLCRYGHGHGAILPNMVPQEYLARPGAGDRRAIGWTGSIQTHGADLQVTSSGVRQALNTYPDWHFEVVGTGEGVQAALDLADPPTAAGWVPFEDYPAEMGKINIGIVPLKLDPFNLGKSSLKMSEFAALGVPVVASPTPDNVLLHNLGVGILARPKRWWVPIKKLMANPELRAELAGRGRDVMATRTYEKTAGMWHDAWRAAVRVAA